MITYRYSPLRRDILQSHFGGTLDLYPFLTFRNFIKTLSRHHKWHHSTILKAINLNIPWYLFAQIIILNTTARVTNYDRGRGRPFIADKNQSLGMLFRLDEHKKTNHVRLRTDGREQSHKSASGEQYSPATSRSDSLPCFPSQNVRAARTPYDFRVTHERQGKESFLNALKNYGESSMSSVCTRNARAATQRLHFFSYCGISEARCENRRVEGKPARGPGISHCTGPAMHPDPQRTFSANFDNQR